MIEKKKILFISYMYPPMKSVGGLRSYYFSKYLNKLGWDVSIITLKNKSKNLNEIMEEKLKRPFKIYFSKNIFSLRRFTHKFKFFIPDFDIGWILPTFEICKKIVEKNNIQVIYATCSPFSSALIGVLIKKTYDIPLVLDFRDPWTFNWETYYPTRIHKSLDNFLEAYVLRSADHLVVVTENMKMEYMKKYRFIHDKISVIKNGFDFFDLPNQRIPSFIKFTIIYCGSFYGSRQPDLFLNGLKKAIIEKKISSKYLQALFLGPENKHIIHLIKDLNLNQFAFYLGNFHLKKALEYMLKSHMLLLIEPRPALTNKVFEYLATGKPILALVSKGELEVLVNKYSNTSYVLTSGDSTEVAEAIYDCYNKWFHNRYELTRTEKVEVFRKKYNRQVLTEQLEVIIDQLLT